MSREEHNIYTGIELGTSTIKVAIAEALDEEGTLDLIALDETKSFRMLKGEPMNPRIVAEYLHSLLTKVLYGLHIKRIPNGPIVAIASGEPIKPQRLITTLELDPQQPISETTFLSSLNDAGHRLPPVPKDRWRFPFILDSRFKLGDGTQVFTPIGQYSSQLTIEQLYCEMDTTYHRKLTEGILAPALRGRNVDMLCYAPMALYASTNFPFRQDEPQGVIIDIGGGMTTYAIPTFHGMMDFGQIALGCDHIANDLDIGLELNDIDTARNLLRHLGTLRCSAIATHDGNARYSELTLADASHTRKQFTSERIEVIVEARLAEMFEVIRDTLIKNDIWKYINQEIFLSGGVTMIPRVAELASQILGRTVKICSPEHVKYRIPLSQAALPRYNMVLGAIRAAQRSMLIDKETARPTMFQRFRSSVLKLYDAFK